MKASLWLLLVFNISFCFGFIPGLSSFGKGVDIQLQEAEYQNGVMSTDKGGIIKGKDFFLQAKDIRYTKKGEGDELIHKVEAENQLLVRFKDRFYKGDKVELNLVDGKLVIWNGTTQSGFWFIGGRYIEILQDGSGTIHDAYVTTSENERADWTLSSQEARVTKDSQLHATNVTFYFIKLPLFWVPSISTDLLKLEGAPFRYRARWGGREGFRFGISYLFATGPCKHRALVDYSVKNGFGIGLKSRYISHSSPAKFEALNYVAQGRKKKWDSARYRLQGAYKNYFSSINTHLKVQYDKLSDRRMKYDFSDHAISDARAGLTQAKLWRNEPNWRTDLNTTVRINDFQNVKQKLPFLTYQYRTKPIGHSPLLLSTQLSTGYLDFVYAKKTPYVHNFHSARTELDQKIFTSKQLSILTVTPSLGYSIIQYSNSPQHQSRLQAIGRADLNIKTRFIHHSEQRKQILEPYVNGYIISRPPVQANKTYIFGLNDGWAQINGLQYGCKHFFYLAAREDGFRPQLRTDLYARSFFATRHLSEQPYKLWLTSTWDATPWASYKLESAWDFRDHTLDHLNLQMRQTLSESLALILEWRQRSKYAWRKLDAENFIVEAVRSPHKLKHSQMSDDRKTLLGSLVWSPLPTFDLEYTAWKGWRKKKNYLNSEIEFTTLIRGALRLGLSYYWRPGGGGNGWNFSLSLGQKKGSSSTSFNRIGQGRYDLW